MKRMNIMIIITFFFFALSFANDNILLVNSAKLYFSIGGQISWNYYKVKKHIYNKKLNSFIAKKNENNQFIGFQQIDLPDSLINDFLLINKGYNSLKIQQNQNTPFAIEGFKTTFCDASGLRVMISVPDKINYEWNDLFIISKNLDDLNQITPVISSKINSYDVKTNLSDSIARHLIINRVTLEDLVCFKRQIPDSLNKSQLKQEIISRLDLSINELNNNCYTVNNLTKVTEMNCFFSVILPNKEVILKANTVLNDTFIISDKYYFYCTSFSPGSGGRAFIVYCLQNNELVKIFVDSSSSM